MRAVLRQNVTIVWLGLALATCLSWWLGTEGGLSHTLATVAIIVVAFTKVRFIGLWFMELREAVLPLRLIFEIYVTVVPAALIVMYVVGS